MLETEKTFLNLPLLMASTRALSSISRRALARILAIAWMVAWVCEKWGISFRDSIRTRAESGEGAERRAFDTTKESRLGSFKKWTSALGELERRRSLIASIRFARWRYRET